MVQAISSGSATLPQSPVQKTTDSVKTQSVAASGANQPAQTSDLLYKPTTFKDNEAFALVAEAGAKQEKQLAYKKEGGLSKFSKGAFDLFSTKRTSAQAQLQSLLSYQTLSDINSLLESIRAAEAEGGGASSATAGEGSGSAETSQTTGDSSQSSGSTDSGSSSGGGTGTGDSGSGGTDTTTPTDPTNTSPGKGNKGKGYGKGGINK